MNPKTPPKVPVTTNEKIAHQNRIIDGLKQELETLKKYSAQTASFLDVVIFYTPYPEKKFTPENSMCIHDSETKIVFFDGTGIYQEFKEVKPKSQIITDLSGK